MNHNFRELRIWKDAIELVVASYKVANQLPDVEKYGLISQVYRSSASIPTNIAEGCGRGTDRELSRFLGFSLGSAFELETHLTVIGRVYPNVGTKELMKELRRNQNFIFKFKKKLDDQNK
ncbi:MAG: four helix bundle protein [Crocinitomicaceae bacterium]|nr:four helix bundle protein [Crocinitomicaceae bacterium]